MNYRTASLLAAGALVMAVGAPAALANPPGAPGEGGLDASTSSYDPTADYQAGVKALQDGDHRTAVRHFDKVLAALPLDANVLLLSGMAKAGSNDLRGAQRSLERAVRADVRNVDARRELALLYARQGEAGRAGDELKALKSQVESCRGSCPDAAKLGAAVAAVESALASKPSAAAAPSLMFASAGSGDAAYLDAIGLVNTGRYEAAIARLRAAERAFGPHPDVLTYLGFTHRKLGRLDEAEGFYRAALAVAPQHRAATEYYGELKIERGDLAGARAMLTRLGEICAFGCPEEQELRRWVEAAERS